MLHDFINYSVIAGVSTLFLIGCLAHLSENDVFSKKRICQFQNLIYVLMFETLIDWVFEALVVVEAPVQVLYVVKATELIVNPTLIYLVFLIFYDKKNIKQEPIMQRLRKIILATIVGNVFLQSLALFGLNVFSIDAERQYHREILVCIYVILLLIGVFAMMHSILVFSSKTQSTMRVTMLAFAFILLASIMLRALFVDNNYDFLCMSVAMLFLLIYYSHLTLRVDYLTRLLNQNVYRRVIKSIDYTTIIIVIDANYFKEINDLFGHECGDHTLKQIGHAILEAYGQYASCYRMGGDEFCAILKPDMFDKLISETPRRDAYLMAEKFMARLDEAIQIESDKGNDEGFLEYGVSQGYGIYYSESGYPDIEERMTPEMVAKLADECMYEAKKLYKEKHPIASRATEPTPSRPKVTYKEPKVEVAKQPGIIIEHQTGEIHNIEHIDTFYS